MSLALKTNPTLTKISRRAELLFQVRQFFLQRNVTEVETPVLCRTSATDPHIDSLKTTLNNETFYLQTSPEFAMKKLVSQGSGAIFQICKAFRHEPHARFHNPEFTMLEWYRPGFTYHQLMDEIDALMNEVTHQKPARRITYRDIFLQLSDIDPLNTTIDELKQTAKERKLNAVGLETKHDWLDLLFTHLIQPSLQDPIYIIDYPSSQAALAKIRHDNPPVAERFELFVNGIELANGFQELTDAKEQLQRFISDNEIRKKLGHDEIPIDYDLLKALENNFPICAGVALGFDRLLMIKDEAEKIADVINFSGDQL